MPAPTPSASATPRPSPPAKVIIAELVNALGTLLMRHDAGGKPFAEDWDRARRALALARNATPMESDNDL